YLLAGLLALIPILAFTLSYRRVNAAKFFAMSLALSYVGLSLFVTYMRDRLEIRDVVWGESSISERVDAVTGSLGGWDWFDPNRQDHLDLIDSRLNQNYLVGVAVERLDSGLAEFASGQTLVDAIEALIPRAIWIDKPISAGSGDLVSRFTGIPFN